MAACHGHAACRSRDVTRHLCPFRRLRQDLVVDQAGASDASSKKSHGTAADLKVFQRIERFRAGDLCIVESGQWLGFYRFPENLSNPAGLSLTGGDGLLGVFECPKSTTPAPVAGQDSR